MANYTKKAIIQTFQEMLSEMPFDRITVSEIVARCEISSNTFYYHYRDIYDLLDVWLQQMEKRYFIDTMSSMTWKEALKLVLHAMKDNSGIVYHLFESLSRERIEQYIFESIGDKFYEIFCRDVNKSAVPEQTLRMIAEYHSYSFLGFFLKFLWNHMEDDIDECIDKIDEIYKKSIQWVIEYHKQ